MIRTLRGQFILSHILPFALILPLVGLVILYLVEAQIILTDLSATLEERAALISEAVARQPEILADQQGAARFISDMSALTDGDIYLLDANGDLIASDGDPAGVPDTTLIDEMVQSPGTVRVATSYGIAMQEGEALAPVIDIDEQLIGIVAVRESISGLAAAFGPLRRLVGLTILGGMALGLAVGYGLAGRLARPIGRAASAVGDIARGEQTSLLPPDGPIELRRLAESVNALAERLRALEEMRRRSFANIVHELGRPLGAVLAAVDVLRGRAGDDPEVRAELLAGVHTEITALTPLLDDMSQLHANATGNLRLDRRPVLISDWLHETVMPWREAVGAKGLGWVVEIPAGLPEANIDPQRLAQVLGNLISNAVKYTDSGGIAVSAAAGDGEIHIAVADTGPGIPPDEQRRVFEPFYRGQTPQRTTEGLGVGLSIARSLTEAHGGRLTLDSAPGRGSVFTIHLPHG